VTASPEQPRTREHSSIEPRGGAATTQEEGQSPEKATSAVQEAAQEPNPVKRLLKVLGPGLITGAADDDPSAVSTYSVAGASFGFAMLWTAPLTLPMMAAVVYICGKIGMVSGMGLAAVLRRHYPRWVLYPAVGAFVIANTLNGAADIGAVAAGLNLLIPIPTPFFVVGATLLVLSFQLFGSYETLVKYLKWLTLALFAYVAAALLAKPPPGPVLWATVVPTIVWDAQFVSTLVAILGTTISPYLYFWQAAQQVEEEVTAGRNSLQERRGASDEEMKYLGWDINAGMFFSNVAMYFIILASATTLHAAGRTDIDSAAAAAEALRPLAGDVAGILFAVGFIGVGLIGIPVMTTGAAYALSEAMGWPHGLHKKAAAAKRFYGVVVVCTLVGMALNFVGINPIRALVWVAVINGLLMGPLLTLILLIANNRQVMGERTNGWGLNLLGGLTALAGFASAISLAATWIMSK
jgi:NRAMP (natural resistance-associated macrophage protein)-like metal ion transporter